MIYLASPYSHPDPEVREARYRVVSTINLNLIKQGLVVYSPIAHCHPLLQFGSAQTDFVFWQAFDEDIISCCDKLIVLKMPGWLESIGVQAEIKFATEMQIPIEYMEYTNGIASAATSST